MGTTAARKARMILDNSQKVVGIELLAAAQALWLRGESLLAPATAAVYQKIRQTVPPVDTDVVMYPQMARLRPPGQVGRIARSRRTGLRQASVKPEKTAAPGCVWTHARGDRRFHL